MSGTTVTEAPNERTEWLPSPHRVRVVFNGEAVADSGQMMLLRQHGFLPVYYFPERDVRTDLLEPSDHTTYSPYKGVASYWSVRAGDRVAESAAWSYPDPKPGSPDTRGYFSFDWHSMDAWFEDGERVYVHARDPFMRIETAPVAGRVEVVVDGTVVADSRDAVVLREAGIIPRYYFPPEDVRLDLLVASDWFTMCPFKGQAGYHSLRVGEALHENAVWYYLDPLPGVAAVAGRLCFWNERVDAIVVDGERLPRPVARPGGDGSEPLPAWRTHYVVPPPASMRGVGPGRLQHDFARPNGRAEGPPLELVDMTVERAGGRGWGVG